MISISTDNFEIFQLLEKCNCVFQSFSFDRTILFDHEDDCYVVFYSAKSRNFTLFKGENFMYNQDVLPTLLNTLQDFEKDNFSDSIIEEAIRLVENKMHSKNSSSFFFDAH